MELTQIKVSADYCFGDAPIVLANLAKVNFVYAPNGAGKTTISNSLSRQPINVEARLDWQVAATETSVRVFNEAYRSRVLTEYVDGIFTIGSESDDANHRIASLETQRRERRTSREASMKAIGLSEEESVKSGLLGELESDRLAVRDSVFELHKEAPLAVRAAVFKGVRASKDKFFDEALTRFTSELIKPKDVTWAALERRQAALAGDLQRRNDLPSITTLSLLTEIEIAQLSSNESSGGTGDFAALIQHLANDDWVSEGREHIQESGGRCPFCQQDLPKGFEAGLAEYFAVGYDRALELASTIASQLTIRSNALSVELNSIETAAKDDSAIDAHLLVDAVAAVRTGAALVVSRVDDKRRHPTTPIVVDDIVLPIRHLNEIVSAERSTIARHNQLVDHASAEAKSLSTDGWALFLTGSGVASQLKRYIAMSAKKRERIEALKLEIQASEEADLVDEKEIKTLLHSVSNTAGVAERINGLLRALGFHRFSLSVADAVAGGYRIVRANGSLAFDSLSEGEKSFLCFAYFLESLTGSAVSGGPAEPVIAIIDDPISSLDSDTLFIVAAYIRDLAKKVIGDETNIRQLIVLTHNTQFHHEAAYTVNDAKGGDRRHYRLLKGFDGVTTVQDDGTRSMIRGSYELLWQAVVDIASGDDESATAQVGVFNIARRIIEGYFKTVGSARDAERAQALSVTDERLVSMFLIWASSGSHTIVDGFAQSHDLGGTRRFLQLLQMFFDQQGHIAHFDMMVRASGGAQLLEAGSVFDLTAH